MFTVNIQSAISEYHEIMKQMGMDMHTFHANWHQQNPDPIRPDRPNQHWGANNSFGKDFLQMHHEMVNASDTEAKYFMHHKSLISWFNSKNYDIPHEWNPLTSIPIELAFHPQDHSLNRITDNPHYKLPNFFTVQGIAPGENPEPITRATKLSDFENLNQLGSCIVFYHNHWHAVIGGAMSYFDTAIDDPIFYFGVHWHIDKVYRSFLELRSVHDFTATERNIPDSFTAAELEQLKSAKELGLKTRRE